LFSSEAASELKRYLLEKDHDLILHKSNLVDEIWGSGRPNLPSSQLRVHDIKYAGIDVTSKLQNLRKELSNAGASAIIVTMLDEVAWLFNLVSNLTCYTFSAICFSS
jgi:Xaa-Pro aminopeptidase